MENVNLTPLTDEEIDELGLSVSDLWMLQAKGTEVQGPFSTKYLNEKAREHEDFFESSQVYNLVIEEWKDFFSSAEFQRRKPKLVPAQNLIQNEDFYLIQKGQKIGPFKLAEVKAKVESREIQVSDEVSVDEGKTWIKLYEHHEFDRRLMKNQEDLPFQPEAQVFEESDKVASLEVARAQKSKEDESAITGLAFLGRGNDKGQTLKSNNEASPESHDHDDTEVIEFKLPESELSRRLKSIKWKYVAGFFIFFLMSFGLFNTFNNKFNSNFDKTVEKANEDASKAVNNSDRSIATKKTIQRKPTRRMQAKRPSVKRYEPKRVPAQSANKPRKTMRVKHRIEHTYDDYENLDIDDPQVREELSRELAGDYENEDDYNRDDYGDNYDNQNDYVDDYQQEKEEMRTMDNRMDNQARDNYDDGYPQDNYDNQQYDDAPPAEPGYEEVSDYE